MFEENTGPGRLREENEEKKNDLAEEEEKEETGTGRLRKENEKKNDPGDEEMVTMSRKELMVEKKQSFG